MFTSLKGKLLNVSKNVGFIHNNEKITPQKRPINVNAGAEILSHFQQQWAELHEINEGNAESANEVAETIEKLHLKMMKDQINVTKLIELLSSAPLISKSVEICVDQVSNLHDCFERVENMLMFLEDLIEKQEIEQRKVDHKHQLTLYKEKKLANLEEFRVGLAAKHSQKCMEEELKQKKMLEERQQAFQEAFDNDVETYKSLGNIPKIETKQQSSALLEEIQLDYDQNALDKFLEET